LCQQLRQRRLKEQFRFNPVCAGYRGYSGYYGLDPPGGVYAAYIQEPAGSSSNPTQRQASTMPDIVGLEENAAVGLQNMGLELVVEGEEPHPELPLLPLFASQFSR
jgi:hypothetical protein